MNNVELNQKKVSAGYYCWLGYRKLEASNITEKYKSWCRYIVKVEDTPIINCAVNELRTGIRSMLGNKQGSILTTLPEKNLPFIILGTLGHNDAIDCSVSDKERNNINNEGYLIKNVVTKTQNYIILTGTTEQGVLYGVFELLRLLQTQADLDNICKLENPFFALRTIDHWDNMDGSIERGYAGNSIFYKDNKFIKDTNRIRDYARLLCSIGINSIVINNVNVHKYETKLITEEYLPKAAKLADIFREYGIRMYFSINFASPMEIGGLTTADPLDEEVKKWWSVKAQEIYKYIPDFGGFLVKADSEGRPGPFTYGRTHADGANMLGEALRPHGGILVWRCFVYNCKQDWRDTITDRARAAYDNFMPLDGKFIDNVYLQIKNGPVDFQVREPVSPLFGALENTNNFLELQITQEYTGQQRHLCCLIPMWKEIMDFDTGATSGKSTVKSRVNGVAAVVNVGDDLNWTGLQLAQSNLYGYGRLLWNPELSASEIIEEWVRMTYSNEGSVVETITDMLLNSWRIYENYTSPLGIGWMVNPSNHYGPNVDGYEYDKWGTYHRADHTAIGVDRSVKSGTGFAGQYCKEVAKKYEDMATCPEELLLFFHRVPYSYLLKSGETLIQHIYNTHFEGVEQVEGLISKWNTVKGKINDDWYNHVLTRLQGQLEHSKEWRDIINTYFYRKTGIADRLGRKIY